MPLFMANFGSTLDALGEPVDEGADQESVVDQVASFCILFGVIGLVSGVAGFTMVTLWSIAGERQVTFTASNPVVVVDSPVFVVLGLVFGCCCCCRTLGSSVFLCCPCTYVVGVAMADGCVVL